MNPSEDAGARVPPPAQPATSAAAGGAHAAGSTPTNGATPTAAHALVAAGAATTLAVLPLFLFGACAVLIRAEMGFNEVQLGVVAAAYAIAAFLASVPAGQLAERLGSLPTMRLSLIVTAVSLAAVAGVARSWAWLCLFMALGGIANALVQPSANTLLFLAVPNARQGLAFGVKQAATPAAGVVAGLALPVVALTLGWRWAFALAAALTVVAIAALPRWSVQMPARRPGARRRAGDVAALPLVLLAVAVSFAAAAANAMSAFYVEAAVAGGLPEAHAGWWLVLGGATGIAGRVLWGWVADRRGRGHFLFVALLMFGGTAGFALLAFGPTRTLALAFGTVLGFTAGWGWPGLFNFAVVRTNRNAPGAATGITQSGIFLGTAYGPPLFGMIAQYGSYRAAWLTSAVALMTAAGLVLVGRRALVRDVRQRDPNR